MWSVKTKQKYCFLKISGMKVFFFNVYFSKIHKTKLNLHKSLFTGAIKYTYKYRKIFISERKCGQI